MYTCMYRIWGSNKEKETETQKQTFFQTEYIYFTLHLMYLYLQEICTNEIVQMEFIKYSFELYRF